MITWLNASEQVLAIAGGRAQLKTVGLLELGAAAAGGLEPDVIQQIA
jgi:hypothetical protein